MVAEREFLSMAGGRRPGSLCALKVVGDYMRDDGILDGDYVLVERVGEGGPTPAPGDRLVVTLPDGAAEIRVLELDGAGVRQLRSRKPDASVLPESGCTVVGIIRSVLRKY